MNFGQLLEYNKRNIFNNKNELYKTLEYWSRDNINFNFLEKGLGLVSPPHFVYDFWRKIFLMLHSRFNCLIALLYFSRYWAIYVLQLFINQAGTS